MAKWHKTIGHIGVEYTPDEDRLFYGRISTGYRAGGFNYDGPIAEFSTVTHRSRRRRDQHQTTSWVSREYSPTIGCG